MDISGLISDVLSMLRRRWLLLAAPFAIGTGLALLVAFILPPVYVSQARILVEAQQIPTELARSTVTAAAAERIQVIQQRLLTRETMLDIARRFDVFRNRPEMTPNEIVAAMTAATTIEQQALGAANRARGRGAEPTSVTTMRIAFSADRAQVAAQVANELVNRVLAENLETRSARAASTLAFFNQEVERLSAELAARERAITQFKNENDDALPDSLTFRRGELAGLRERMFAREAELIALQEQKRTLEQSVQIGQVAVTGRQLTPAEQELDRLRRELAAQRAVYADTHPVMRALSARVAALEAALGGGVAADIAATDGVGGAAAAETLRQIEQIERQIALREQQRAADEARVAELEASIARTPQVEIALGALLRDLETVQVQHQQAVLKRSQAETGERLEVSQQAERFEVIEQPLTPEGPAAPNRPLIAAIGMVGSFGLGGALMVLAELLNRAIRTPRDLERQLQLRPIVAIPYIATPRERRLRRWRFWTAALAVAVVAPLALLAVDRYVRPLPILMGQILDKSGAAQLITLIEQRFGR